MATYYWVGGAGTWNNTNTTNWSGSSGGAGGSGPPTSADDVIFDSASDTGGNFTVTLSTTASCKDFTCTAPDVTITFSGIRISCYGSFTMSGTNTVTTSCRVSFLSTTTGNTVTLNGKVLGNSVIINGVGGEWTQADAFSMSTSGNFTLTAGTWKTGNFNITGGDFTSTGTATRSIELGSSTVTLSGGGWEVTGTGFSINAGTSTISLGSSSPQFFGNSNTYYNVTQTSSLVGSNFQIAGANTFNNLTATVPSGTGVKEVVFFDNQTINGTLSVSGGSSVIRRTHVRSDTIGTTRTLTCATVAATTDSDFRDITIAGVAAPVSGTRLGDGGGNSGITFVAGTNKYWNLSGSQNITATGWALSSGASPSLNNFPLPQDTIIFDNTGAAGTVACNADFMFGTFDMSARTSAMTFNITNSDMQIKGNLTVGTGVTWGGSGSDLLLYTSDGAALTLDSNGQQMASDLFIDVPGGSVTLADIYNTGTASLEVDVRAGTFDSAGFDITCNDFISDSTNTRTITLSSSTLTLYGTGNLLTLDTTNLTLNATSSTVVSSNTTNTSRTFVGANLTWGNLVVGGGASTATFSITGANTFNTISHTRTAAYQIQFPSATTTVSDFTISGSLGNLVQLIDTGATGTFTITKTGGGIINGGAGVDFLSISRSAATPASTWYAGANSTDGGSNTGWIFTAPPAPATATGNFFQLFFP
jgi:fibronectin-binding autotransporter adhesin